MISSTDAKKHFWQNSTTIYDENTEQTRSRRKLPQHNKNHIWKPTANILNGKRLQSFLLKSETGQGCLISPFLFNMHWKFLPEQLGKKSKGKSHLNWKEEIQLTLFTEYMILLVENPKDFTRKKLLELINEFNKVSGYKVSTQKSVTFLYTNNKQSEKEIKKKF